MSEVCNCVLPQECKEVQRITQAAHRILTPLSATLVIDDEKLETFVAGCKNGQRRRAEFRALTQEPKP